VLPTLSNLASRKLSGPAAALLAGGLLLAVQYAPVRAQVRAAGKADAAQRNRADVAPGDLAILDARGQVVGQCPLKRTSVNADVTGFVSRVTVTQEFQNPSRTPVEAVYTFPLPHDAAVDDMKMTLGDRTIAGRIKRKEEARKIYEAARAAGQTASLLDQERPNIFTQSVANMMPGQKVTVTLSYVNLLKYDDGSYEFTFPMVVGPRNTAGAYYDGAPGTPPVLNDAGAISPPIAAQGTRAGHDISLSINLDAGLPLQELKSQLHEIVVERDGANRAKIRLKSEDTIPNRDFILRYTVGGEQMQTGVLAHSEGNGSGYFTLILQPPSAPRKQDVAPKEMVFVIDQTGSQRGLPIAKAKQAMQYCLENLNPGDTFQLIGFNTQIFPCFDAPVPLNEANLKQALEFLAPIEGNGGTDILKSVDYALKIPADPARLRMICYMTDGYIGNDMQVVDYVRKNRGQARMFVFGIGNSVNRFLIEGMAREGRGAAEIVDLKMPGEKAAARFYARVHKPILLDPRVEFGSLTVEDVLPRVVPDVFTAGPIILKGRYRGAPEGDLTVSGILRGQPWSQTVHVKFPAVAKEGAAIPTLWAREKLEDLQSQDWMGAQSGSPDAGIKEQIVNLALDYRLMSQYTSFVAVEDRVVNVGGKQRRVDVPVEMPEGVSYEGIFGEGFGVPAPGDAGIAVGFNAGEARESEVLLRQQAQPGFGRRSRAAKLEERSGGDKRKNGSAPLPGKSLFSLGSSTGANAAGSRPVVRQPGPGGGLGGAGGGGFAGGYGLGAPAPAPAAVPGLQAAAPAGKPLAKLSEPKKATPSASGPAPASTPARTRALRLESKARVPLAAGRKQDEAARDSRRPLKETVADREAVDGLAVLNKPAAEVAPQELARFRQLMDREPEQAGRSLAAMEAEKRLAMWRKLKPAQRLALLRTMKLSPSLRTLAATLKKDGANGTLLKAGLPEVRGGRALVQVWLRGVAPRDRTRLKALGFLSTAELKPKELVLGSIPVAALVRLADLECVSYVDVPKFIDY
jgi:Ca-activated chloride channel homolog